MEDEYIGTIKLFAGNFIPKNFLQCAGQLLSVNSYPALFALIGSIYGGDGRTTFRLPDLRGRVPTGAGTGQGLSPVALGASYGSEINYLSVAQLPAHNHSATATPHGSNSVKLSTDVGIHDTPQAGDVPSIIQTSAGISKVNLKAYGPAVNTVDGQSLNPTENTINIGNTGSNLPVNNLPPSQAIYYIICAFGLYPSRS